MRAIRLLIGIFILLPALAAGQPARTQIVMLGTGTPIPDPDRSGPGVAIVVDSVAYLFDAGAGIVRRASAAGRNGVKAFAPRGASTQTSGQPSPRFDRVFLTHLHSDHTLGLADVIFTPWIQGRAAPLDVYGPVGTRRLVDGILDGGGSTASRAVTAAYPMMDVVLLAGLAGFFVTAAWRAPAFVLLVASVVALLVSDEVYGVGTNAHKSGDWTDLGWLLSYILWAAAALHPSMKELSQPRRRRSYLRVHPVRIALLAAALLSAPFVLLVQYLRDAPLNVPAIVIAATAISLFVLMRLVGILRALERLRERERSARADAEQAQMLLAMQNDQLVEADKLKDEFVALISHDLRTPLTSIIGYVELSLEDVPPPLDDERRGYLQIVSRSSERLLRLVDDLLFVARLQAGRLILERSDLDLCTIAAQAAQEARPRAEAKQLELEFIGGSPVMIEGDKGRLFQLLDNLISNAIKFTPEGGRVEVRVAPSGGMAMLEVSDTGIGLGPDEAELVFDRFFRSSRVVAQQVPGTGLGLFIARAIVGAHAGTIAASTREGGGTTFHVELHARVASQPADPELVA